MHLLGKISSREWRIAKAYFNHPENDNKMKLSRKTIINNKPDVLTHSFVKINNVIYAIANQSYLGSGSFGCVKIAQNEAGENFAIKIEQIDSEIDHAFATKRKVIELKILSKIADPDKFPFLKGYAERHFNVKQSKQKEVHNNKIKTLTMIDIIGKRYTVTSLIKGQELWDHPEIAQPYSYTNSKGQPARGSSPCNMTTYKKFQYALQTTKALKMIHDRGLIHGDFKPTNLIYQEDENGISIFPIDFGMSFILKSRRFFSKLSKKKRKTPPLEEIICARDYRAPEIDVGNRITAKSDIYSLGVIFDDNLKLPNEFTDSLLDVDPSARPSCTQIIKKLKSQIRTIEKKSDMIVSQFIELITQYVKPSDIEFKLDKIRNALDCRFYNLHIESIDHAIYALESAFDKNSLSFNRDDASHLTIDLYANNDFFSTPGALDNLKQDINARLDIQKKSSHFFESILAERQKLKLATRFDSLLSEISSKDRGIIYDYLLEYKFEIEEGLWEMGLGTNLRIEALPNCNVSITRNQDSFTLNTMPILQDRLNLPDSNEPSLSVYTLRKSKAYESIRDHLAGSSALASSQQPCSSTSALCSSFKHMELNIIDIQNQLERSTSRSSSRSSPR